jgi:hypothetical protein
MSPEDRKAIGQMTAAEAAEKWQAKNERDLQGQCVNLLRQKGVEVLWHRTDKRSHATKGWPDITFATFSPGQSGLGAQPCAWEIKFGEGELSPGQEKMIDRLRQPPNSWRIKIIRSLPEAIHEMHDLGL